MAVTDKKQNSMKKIPVKSSKEIKRDVAKSATLALLENIERLQHDNGIETERLAFESGHSTQHFKEIISGKRMPGSANLIGIVHALSALSGKRFTVEIREL